MKPLQRLIQLTVAGASLLFTATSQTVAQGLTLPQSDSNITSSISSTLPTPYTPDELALPPAGEIRKLNLRSINRAKAELQAVITGVPVPEQTNSNYARIQAAFLKLDTLSTNRQQAVLFELISILGELDEAAKSEDNPAFVRAAADILSEIKPTIIREIANYITRLGGTVPASDTILFVDAFATGNIAEEGAWENTAIPVSSPELLTLDPVAIVTHFKSQPWKKAERFLGGATAAEAFVQCEPTGDALAVFKTKYAADQTLIIAQWNDLTAWVALQRITNP